MRVETTLLVGYPLLIAASGLWWRVRLVWITTGWRCWPTSGSTSTRRSSGAAVRLAWNPSPDLQHPNIFLAGLLLDRLRRRAAGQANPALEPVLRTSAQWREVVQRMPTDRFALSPRHQSGSARAVRRGPRTSGSAAAARGNRARPLAVKVAREADQVGLDLPGMFAEGRVGPDIARGRPGRSLTLDPGEPGIDAFGRDERIDAARLTVGNPMRRPSARSLGDRAADSMRPAQVIASASSTCPSLRHRRIKRRRDQLIVDHGHLDDLEIDPCLGSTTLRGCEHPRCDRDRTRSSALRRARARRAGRG